MARLDLLILRREVARRALAITLDAARNACNAILRQARRRDFVRQSKAEQAGTATPCGAPRSTERKARATEFKQVFAAFGVIQKFARECRDNCANKRGGTHYDDGGVCPYYRQLYFDLDVKLDLCTTDPFFAAIGEAGPPPMRFRARNFSRLDFIGSRRSRRALSTPSCRRSQVGDAHGFSCPLHAMNVTALPMTKCAGACR
jgi:hypothetical protein